MASKFYAKDKQLVRPTTFTPDAQRMIFELITEGNFLGRAVLAAGLSRCTWRYWVAKYEDGEAPHLHEFFERIDQAIAWAEVNALRRLRTGKSGWQAEAWFLERRHPDRWGRRDMPSRPAKIPPLSKPISEMTDEELDQRASDIAAAGGPAARAAGGPASRVRSRS
jgi:hypothetical protein